MGALHLVGPMRPTVPHRLAAIGQIHRGCHRRAHRVRAAGVEVSHRRSQRGIVQQNATSVGAIRAVRPRIVVMVVVVMVVGKWVRHA